MTTSCKIEDVDFDFMPTSTGRLKEGIDFDDFMKNRSGFFEVASVDQGGLLKEDSDEERELQQRIIDSQNEWQEDVKSSGGDYSMKVSEAEHLEPYSSLEARMKDVIYDIDGSLLEFPGGVKKRTVRNGTGERAKRGDLVWVHYKLFLEACDESFDATVMQNNPKRFTVGHGEVIRGLDIALMGMKPGQTDHCIVTHHYAFGPLGCPPRIPKEAKVLMYIRLLRIHCSETEIAVEDMSYEERKGKEFKVIYDAAERRKTIGNDHLLRGEKDEAIREYLRAQELTNELIPVTESESYKTNILIYSIQLNLAKVYIENGRFRKAIRFCNEALAVPVPEARKTKAYYRLAKALFEAGKVEEAEEPIKTAHGMCIDNNIVQLYNEITSEVIRRKNKERETAKKMFQNLKLN